MNKSPSKEEINQDSPANPTPYKGSNDEELYCDNAGLTKLEQATITIAAGIMANPKMSDSHLDEIKRSARILAIKILRGS